ncbi:MAG: hypothetical protein ACLTWO_03040 [Blautia massiliensis (ex Durand et al. 2017)]
MKKTLWLLLYYPLQLLGAVLALYPVLALLCFLFGANSLFGTYLTGYSFAFLLCAVLCAVQATATYCPLALSLGATRRALQAGVAAVWVIFSLLGQAVSMVLNQVTFALFPSERLSREFVYGISRDPLPGLGVTLFIVGASLWTGALQRKQSSILRQVLLVLFDIVIYAQVFVFMALSVFAAQALPLYGGVLALLGLVFTADAVRRMKTLAVSQV